MPHRRQPGRPIQQPDHQAQRRNRPVPRPCPMRHRKRDAPQEHRPHPPLQHAGHWHHRATRPHHRSVCRHDRAARHRNHARPCKPRAQGHPPAQHQVPPAPPRNPPALPPIPPHFQVYQGDHLARQRNHAHPYGRPTRHARRRSPDRRTHQTPSRAYPHSSMAPVQYRRSPAGPVDDFPRHRPICFGPTGFRCPCGDRFTRDAGVGKAHGPCDRRVVHQIAEDLDDTRHDLARM